MFIYFKKNDLVDYLIHSDIKFIFVLLINETETNFVMPLLLDIISDIN